MKHYAQVYIFINELNIPIFSQLLLIVNIYSIKRNIMLLYIAYQKRIKYSNNLTIIDSVRLRYLALKIILMKWLTACFDILQGWCLTRRTLTCIIMTDQWLSLLTMLDLGSVKIVHWGLKTQTNNIQIVNILQMRLNQTCELERFSAWIMSMVGLVYPLRQTIQVSINNHSYISSK